MIFTASVIIAMLVITGMAAREVILFRRKQGAYHLRRLTLRLGMASLLLFLLGSLLVGVRIFHLDNPEYNPAYFVQFGLPFWGCIGLLSGAIFCLLLADLRIVRDDIRADSTRLWHDIAQTIADHDAQKKDR